MPPAHQHPERSEPRFRVPVAASRFTEIGAGYPHPLELGGALDHRGQQVAAGLLVVGATLQSQACIRDPVGKRVAQALEPAEVEDLRLSGRSGDTVADLDPAEPLGDQPGQLALEPGDLRAQLRTGGALVDRGLERAGTVSCE